MGTGRVRLARGGGGSRYATESVTGDGSIATTPGAATGQRRTCNSHRDGDETRASSDRAHRLLPYHPSLPVSYRLRLLRSVLQRLDGQQAANALDVPSPWSVLAMDAMSGAVHGCVRRAER